MNTRNNYTFLPGQSKAQSTGSCRVFKLSIRMKKVTEVGSVSETVGLLGFSHTAICRVCAAAETTLLWAGSRNLMLHFTQLHNTGQQKMQKCFLVRCFSSSAATFRHWSLRSLERKRRGVFKLHSRSFFSPQSKRGESHLIWCKQHKVLDPCCLWFRCWCGIMDLDHRGSAEVFNLLNQCWVLLCEMSRDEIYWLTLVLQAEQTEFIDCIDWDPDHWLQMLIRSCEV